MIHTRGTSRMRLVRDDDVMEPTDVQPPGNDQAETDDADAELPLEAAGDAEQPDGSLLDEASEETGDEIKGPVAADAAVDLRTLEALLFSTHHPLTAGRLAELLELDSTKPLRRAIKQLNEQYITS